MLTKLNQKRLLCSDPTECVSAVLKSGIDPVKLASFGGSSSCRKIRRLFTNVDKIADKEKDSIGAIIFAASSSTKGKNPGVYDACTVDYQGIINSAQFCIQYNISRFIIVSSGAAT
ncbi:hypothetical protein ACHAXS_005994 [Conticribra weissflogii]